MAIALASNARGSARSLGTSPAAAPAVTSVLVDFVCSLDSSEVPANVRKEAVRTFLNWIGCAIGGSTHSTLDIAISALRPFFGREQAQVLGRNLRSDIFNAAMLNGMSSHVLDYDDTHLKTIIHPAGPVASALLALAEHRPVTGSEFVTALVLGIEVECRIGNAVYPDHYERGWHITGTCGTFGAAAACGRLLNLTTESMAAAFGIAASQPVGLKIQFGTMTKCLHPGRAAHNGLTAAMLAASGYTAASNCLEGINGWGQAVSTRQDWSQALAALGHQYESSLNTYKPFACGIVIHPAIDAGIRLREAHTIAPENIKEIVLKANPLVKSLTGNPSPTTGLESKFSVHHAVAAAIVQGDGGPQQFSDAAVAEPSIAALRQRVTLIVDGSIPPEKCELTIQMATGQKLSVYVEDAIGSIANPMSDEALAEKCHRLSDDVVGRARTAKLIELCWGIESMADVKELVIATVPGED